MQKIKNAKISENIKNGPKNLKNVSPENLGKIKNSQPWENPNVRYRTILRANYALAVPKNFGVGVNFRPCNEGYFLSWRP